MVKSVSSDLNYIPKPLLTVLSTGSNNQYKRVK
jgi:hypothetical protein